MIQGVNEVGFYYAQAAYGSLTSVHYHRKETKTPRVMVEEVRGIESGLGFFAHYSTEESLGTGEKRVRSNGIVYVFNGRDVKPDKEFGSFLDVGNRLNVAA